MNQNGAGFRHAEIEIRQGGDKIRTVRAVPENPGLMFVQPHKDDMEVLLDGLSARSYASQGQTRTAALSLKLAAREIHKEIIGEYPID